MSFGEMVVLGVVAIVVVGPRNLPALLRGAGQFIGRVRKMANDLRNESGIDEILNAEGIRSEIDNFRRLASGAISPDDLSPNVVPDRDREYPRVGPDAFGAYSEDLVPYLPAELPSLAAGEESAADGGANGVAPSEGAILPSPAEPAAPRAVPAAPRAVPAVAPAPAVATAPPPPRRSSAALLHFHRPAFPAARLPFLRPGLPELRLLSRSPDRSRARLHSRRLDPLPVRLPPRPNAWPPRLRSLPQPPSPRLPPTLPQ